MKKIPIIIDCDPGVDDSFAIALANSNPNFEIVAITAVEGNVPAELTRYNALCLREIFEMENTKIAYGASEPLVKSYFKATEEVHGGGGIGGATLLKPTRKPEEKPAWDIIYEEAVKHNGELVLIALGPLTNIALTLRKYPDLTKYLKQFIMMGGGTFGNMAASNKTAEFNVWVDPTAAKEVFEKLEVYMIGLDATHACYIKENEFDEMLEITSKCNNKQTTFLYELTQFSKKNSYEQGLDNNIIHDAVAIASMTDVIEFKNCHVWVEDKDIINAGQTFVEFDTSKPKNSYFAHKVNRSKFVQIMLDMCTYYTKKD